MDEALLMVAAVAVAQLIMSPVIVFVIKRFLGRRLDAFDQKRDMARQERQEKYDADAAWQEAMTSGMRSMLRAELVSEHRKWTRRGYCPLESKEYLQRCHNAYVGVGGNESRLGRYTDSRYSQNLNKASAAGLHVGAYYYTVSTTVAEARKDADHFADLLDGNSFDMPLYMDVEDWMGLRSGVQAGRPVFGRRPVHGGGPLEVATAVVA